ncbi:hypothetical protein HPB52_024334 [Rhipicephalus sanguineus]|uniref:Uncharacterized protein n=1 Tax=Rhipicephalus sanguineus TaxID=34632 RepID=A0A9D4TCG7_RHISA|nr:hypothetical protein HPB52_024334 [Rhipicephalus sanguineus]
MIGSPLGARERSPDPQRLEPAEPEAQPVRLEQPLQERRVPTYADALRQPVVHSASFAAPEQHPGCQQTADCGKPLLECVERQCRCVPPNVPQTDGDCGPPQRDVHAAASLLRIEWRRYRKDEDALDEDEMSEAGAGGARVASWSAAKAAASSSVARVQQRASPPGSAASQQGSFEPKSPEPDTGPEREASSRGQLHDVEESERRTMSASSVPESEEAKARSREECALQQRGRLVTGPEDATSNDARKYDAAPMSCESTNLQRRPSSTPNPIKQLSRYKAV